jgi:NACalpha-BTF3-like transcription factor
VIGVPGHAEDGGLGRNQEVPPDVARLQGDWRSYHSVAEEAVEEEEEEEEEEGEQEETEIEGEGVELLQAWWIVTDQT